MEPDELALQALDYYEWAPNKPIEIPPYVQIKTYHEYLCWIFMADISYYNQKFGLVDKNFV